MNKVDATKKVKFTMEIATDKLEFSDLKLKFEKESKQISADAFAKDTNSSTYVLPSTCFPKITLKVFIKVLVSVLERFAIFMRNLKSVVQNTKTI